MRSYGGVSLYAALPLHMQRGYFRIRTHDQSVTKAQIYRCARALPQMIRIIIFIFNKKLFGALKTVIGC